MPSNWVKHFGKQPMKHESTDFWALFGSKLPNGNVITMVVGGQETVLGFDSGDPNSYCASKGASDAVEPVMTCYFMMSHHTEFPRKNVIPVADGVKAVHQFLDSGDLPTCIKWEQV